MSDEEAFTNLTGEIQLRSCLVLYNNQNDDILFDAMWKAKEVTVDNHGNFMHKQKMT